MKTLIAWLFLINTSYAQVPAKVVKAHLQPERIIFNPAGTIPGQFILSYKDYEDIRIDSDLDGLVDYWKVSKGSMYVETYFDKGTIARYYVRKVDQNIVREFHYVMSSGKLVRSQVRSRLPFTRTFTEGSSTCKIDQLKELDKKLESLKIPIEREAVSAAVNNLIDPSCASTLSSEEMRFLNREMSKALSGVTKDISIEGCIKSKNFKEIFFKGEDQDLQHKILVAKFQLQKKQLVAEPEFNKGVIRCEKTDKDKIEPAFTSENRKITLYKSSRVDQKFEINQKTLEHEFLHRVGIFSEQSVREISDYCDKSRYNLKFGENIGITSVVTENAAAANELVSAEQSANASAPVAVATNSRAPASEPTSGSMLASANSSANIPMEMTAAQTDVPSSPTLSESITNPAPRTDYGAQQALIRSAAESRGVLSRANNMIGAMSTPAGASSEKLNLKKSELGNVPASQLGKALKKSDGLAADERIVEEITLDNDSSTSKQAATSSSRGPASVPATRAALPPEAAERSATPSRGGGDTAAVANTTPSSEIGGSGSGSSTPFGGGGGSAPTASSGLEARAQGASRGAPRNSASAPSTASRSGSSSLPASKDEVIKMFSSSTDYVSVKGRLKDQKFNQQLQAQQITIIDLYGNSYGAPRGEVIFLDEGNRFVRQR